MSQSEENPRDILIKKAEASADASIAANTQAQGMTATNITVNTLYLTGKGGFPTRKVQPRMTRFDSAGVLDDPSVLLKKKIVPPEKPAVQK